MYSAALLATLREIQAVLEDENDAARIGDLVVRAMELLRVTEMAPLSGAVTMVRI